MLFLLNEMQPVCSVCMEGAACISNHGRNQELGVVSPSRDIFPVMIYLFFKYWWKTE